MEKILDRKPPPPKKKTGCSSALQRFCWDIKLERFFFREADISSTSKKYGEFCKTQKFISILTTAEKLSLSRATIFHKKFAETSRFVEGTGLNRR
jgi:hypothetical protein